MEIRHTVSLLLLVRSHRGEQTDMRGLHITRYFLPLNEGLIKNKIHHRIRKAYRGTGNSLLPRCVHVGTYTKYRHTHARTHTTEREGERFWCAVRFV